MSRPLALVLALTACGRPSDADILQNAELAVLEAPAAEQRFIDAIQSATTSLLVAVPQVGDPALYSAILDKWLEVRGDPDFEFEVITDGDNADAAGVVGLLDESVPVTLSNDTEVTYFEFIFNDDVRWTSEQTVMSHAYVMVDNQRVVTATTAGTLVPGPRVVLDLHGEDLLDDLYDEHNQVFSGFDATALTQFSAPAKSIADFRWRYPTAGPKSLEMWLSPQERTTKRVIDAVYGARSNIWVMTNDLANEGLAQALKEKASWGFDVRVVVGPDFGTNVSRLSDELLVGRNGMRIRQSAASIPSVVLVDIEPDREGYLPHARGMVLTHSLVNSARYYRNQPVVTDQFIDGALWVISDYSADRAELQPLTTLFLDQFDGGQAL